MSDNAFHEKAGRSQVGWWGFFVDMGLTLPSGLTDAILPSALLMSDSSLGASWAFSLQPNDGSGPGVRRSHRNSAFKLWCFPFFEKVLLYAAAGIATGLLLCNGSYTSPLTLR